jgi:hypothetical protein
MAVDEVTSVYVGGLPYEANEDMLRDAFEYYGTIVSVKVRPAPHPFSSPSGQLRAYSLEGLRGALISGLLRWSEACGGRRYVFGAWWKSGLILFSIRVSFATALVKIFRPFSWVIRVDFLGKGSFSFCFSLVVSCGMTTICIF